MKTLTRTTLASIAVLSVLAACAPARRAANKPAAATNGNQTVPGGLAPFNNTEVINADAHLPAVPPTDLTVPAGTINLTTTTKDQPLIIDLDINGKATVEQAAASVVDAATFNCTAPAQATLDQCSDMTMKVSVKGSDSQDHELDIQISRRGGLNVDEKIITPSNSSSSNAAENPNFGTAFYQSTQATDPNATDKSKSIRVVEIAYIKTAKALPTDVAQDTGMMTWGTSNKVKFYLQGAMVDTAGNSVTCAQPVKGSAACAPVANVAPIEKNTNNLLENYNVQMSDKSLKTIVLTVQSRSTTDPTQIVGKTDPSTFVSTLKDPTTSGGGNNPAPNPAPAPAPANGNTPAPAPTQPTTPAPAPNSNAPATMNSMGSVSSSGGPAQMSKPATPSTAPAPAPTQPTQPAAGNNTPAPNPTTASTAPDGISAPPPNS